MLYMILYLFLAGFFANCLGDFQFRIHFRWCGLCECYLPSRTKVSKTRKELLERHPGEPVPHPSREEGGFRSQCLLQRIYEIVLFVGICYEMKKK